MMPGTANTKVALFIEDDLLRAGLSQVLEDAGLTVGQSARFPEYGYGHQDISLLICDIVYGQRVHEDTVQSLKQRYPTTIIAVVTSLMDSRIFLRVILDGARGFFSKDIDRDTLLGCLNTLLQVDSVVVGPVAIANLKTQLPHILSLLPSDSTPDLQNEEVRILRLLIEGVSIKQIAQAMNLSQRSVGRRIESLREKLGARNSFEAGVIAARAGLI